jgi:hypothetical protein
VVAIWYNGSLVFVFLHLLTYLCSLALNNPIKIALEGMGSVVGRSKCKNVAERKFEGV